MKKKSYKKLVRWQRKIIGRSNQAMIDLNIEKTKWQIAARGRIGTHRLTNVGSNEATLQLEDGRQVTLMPGDNMDVIFRVDPT